MKDSKAAASADSFSACYFLDRTYLNLYLEVPLPLFSQVLFFFFPPNSSIFREMKRYQKDFSTWCGECSREKKERQQLSIATARLVKYSMIACIHMYNFCRQNNALSNILA